MCPAAANRNKGVKQHTLALPSFTRSRMVITAIRQIGGGGTSNDPVPGDVTNPPLLGIVLNNPLLDRQPYPEPNSFHQGLGQICPQWGPFSCPSTQTRGYVQNTPPPIGGRLIGAARKPPYFAPELYNGCNIHTSKCTRYG